MPGITTMKFLETIALVIGAAVIISLVLALPVMWLWNDVMPELFNLPRIGFWKALEISLLASCLFKHSSTKKND